MDTAPFENFSPRDEGQTVTDRAPAPPSTRPPSESNMLLTPWNNMPSLPRLPRKRQVQTHASYSPPRSASFCPTPAASSAAPDHTSREAVLTSPPRPECSTLPAVGGRGEEVKALLDQKRDRERKRRQKMDTKFDELASLLVVSAVQRCDRAGILETATEHIKKQVAQIKELEDRQCVDARL